MCEHLNVNDFSSTKIKKIQSKHENKSYLHKIESLSDFFSFESLIYLNRIRNKEKVNGFYLFANLTGVKGG